MIKQKKPKKEKANSVRKTCALKSKIMMFSTLVVVVVDQNDDDDDDNDES